MIVETLRLWRAALEDVDTGVNAQLEALQVDGDDDRPPPIVRVLDPTQDPEAALDEDPMDWPVIVLAVPGPAAFEGEVNVVGRDRTGTVAAVAIYASGDGDAAQASTHALTTCRAIVRATRRWLQNDRLEDRQRNGVTVRAAESIVFGELRPDELSAAAKAAVEVTYQVRDSDA